MQYRVFSLDDQNRVNATAIVDLNDPCAYKPSEARFEASTAPRANPKRYSPDAPLPEGATEWLNCIQRTPYALLEAMTAEEIATRDADYAAEKDAEEEAQQMAKALKQREMEKRVKDILVALGFTFPLNPANFWDDTLSVYTSMSATVDAVTNLAQAKDALTKMTKVMLVLYMLSVLNAYDPKFGEVGE